MKKLFFLVFFLAFCLKTTSAKVFDAEEFYLDNGLRIIVVENHRAPIVKMMLWYKVGAMDEVAGKSGLAHLLEHLMFRGTTKVPASFFNQLMLQNGVDFNAFTSKDFTVYHALADISRLELVLALEADRMKNLQIDDQAFVGEQKIVYQERQQRIENNPQSLFYEEALNILWNNTPYGHPVAGTLAEIEALTKEDARLFYRSFYHPNNAVLVLSGDIDVKTAQILVEKYFGKIKNTKEKPVQLPVKNKRNGTYQITKELNEVQSTKISLSYIINSVIDDERRAFALSVFSSYFGGSSNSYMKRHLIKPQKVVSAQSSVDIFSRFMGVFNISVLPKPELSDDQNVKMLEDTINEALQGFSLQDLEAEKKKMLSWFVYTKDNPKEAAYIVGQMAALGMSLEKIENYEKLIEDVTLDDVKSSVENMINSAARMIAVVKPLQRKNNQ